MSAENGCFYVPRSEERFRATELTASPWDSSSQHGGPPAALLGHALESIAGGDGGILARLAFEILGPIPVGELSIETKTVRPGRRISLHEATLSDGAEDPVEDLRRGWDLHVGFGLANPTLYALMYGDPRPGAELTAAKEAAEILHGLVSRVAEAGRLRVEVERAARMIHAAGSGVTLVLIGTEPKDRDPAATERTCGAGDRRWSRRARLLPGAA